MIIENHGIIRYFLTLPSREVIVIEPGRSFYMDEKEEFDSIDRIRNFLEKLKGNSDLKVIGDRKVYKIGENIPKKYEEEERIKNMKKNKFENLDI